jgi:hypothetical protein
MKQHHDEEHLGARQLAGALPYRRRRNEPVRLNRAEFPGGFKA